ncbi:MAG TPA: ABC transporter permease [Puia sp.]|nr:ABC transporter permease [Puia sp.]
MLTHYLRIAWRSFRRQIGYNLINIGCLAIGLAAVMTMLLYILHEHSYDSWHANARRIFAVSTRTSYGSSSWVSYQLTYPVGPAALTADPAVESTVREMPAFSGVEVQNAAVRAVQFRETSRFIFADSNFFRFFSFRLLRGSPDNVLARPFTVVLTQSAVKKYFGNVDPVGKTLILDRQYPLEVTGIAADIPSNSSLEFDMVTSITTMRGLEKYKPYLDFQQLENGSFYTWLRLRQARDTARVSRNLSRLALVAAGKLKKTDEPYGETESRQFSLLPLADTHLRSYAGLNGRYLPAFTWVAALILALALVNYMSLATARSSMRAREVGVRKVIGAGRPGIAGQFYTESAMHTLLAFAAGILLFLAFRPVFSRLMQLTIDADFLLTPAVIAAYVLLLLLVIVISGCYPSLVMSAFRPVTVLYGRLSRQQGSERVRKTFLVFQFTLSMTLMTCTFVIAKELYYIRHVDTGVTRDNIVMLPFGSTMHHYGAYQKEVAALPGVQRAATTRFKLYNGSALVQLAQLPGEAATHQMMFMIADSNLIPLLELKWKEKPAASSGWYDRRHLVINEAAVDEYRWRGKATGNSFKFGEDNVTVAGVLKDFNFFSLHTAIAPLGIRVARTIEDEWSDGLDGVLYLKIGPHVNVPTLIEAARRIYSRYDDQTPFEYTFLDDEFNSQYKAEDRLAGLMNIFSAITIVIACLGLFALATFAARQRIREIGIRKVLGASVASISALLSRDFLRPILLSVVIASPVAWWVMHGWLQNFAYRTTISWWIFPAAGGGLLLIAQLTVLFRTIGAAQANPAINLRSE